MKNNIKKITIKQVLEENIDLHKILPEFKKIADKNQNLNFCIKDLFDNCKSNTKIPIAIKDIIHIKGENTTFASKMTKNFVAPVNATIVNKLQKRCSIVMKTNLDEFAIGATGQNSGFGRSLSPWKLKDEHMCPGGSSSGSAIAVATGAALGAIGTETGGSVRCPAAFNGVFGYKPTYGIISRYGIGELVSNFDVVGIFAKTAWDAEWIANQLYGKDINDPTSVNYIPLKETKKSFALFENIKESNEINAILHECANVLKNAGYNCNSIKPPKILDYAVPAYVVLNSCDVASNLSRFDGTLYGKHGAYRTNDSTEIGTLKDNTRDELFGNEIKRRTMIGNAILYYEHSVEPPGLYTKSQQILCEIDHQLKQIFKEHEFILLPVTSDRGPTASEAAHSSVIDMYNIDYYLTWSCMLGIPGITIPIRLNKEGVPLTIQIVGPAMSDEILFKIAKTLDEHFQFFESNCNI